MSPALKHPKKGAGTFSQRLDYLLHNVYPPGRGPYDLDEVCKGIREQTGFVVSQPYLSQLHRGTRQNPSKNHVEAIARFFDVPIEYFFDTTQSQALADALSTVEAIKATGVQSIALRAAALSPAGREAILRIIDEIVAATPPEPRRRGPYKKRKKNTDDNPDNNSADNPADNTADHETTTETDNHDNDDNDDDEINEDDINDEASATT